MIKNINKHYWSPYFQKSLQNSVLRYKLSIYFTNNHVIWMLENHDMFGTKIIKNLNYLNWWLSTQQQILQKG